jgi:hypothetical protein
MLRALCGRRSVTRPVRVQMVPRATRRTAQSPAATASPLDGRRASGQCCRRGKRLGQSSTPRRRRPAPAGRTPAAPWGGARPPRRPGALDDDRSARPPRVRALPASAPPRPPPRAPAPPRRSHRPLGVEDVGARLRRTTSGAPGDQSARSPRVSSRAACPRPPGRRGPPRRGGRPASGGGRSSGAPSRRQRRAEDRAVGGEGVLQGHDARIVGRQPQVGEAGRVEERDRHRLLVPRGRQRAPHRVLGDDGARAARQGERPGRERRGDLPVANAGDLLHRVVLETPSRRRAARRRRRRRPPPGRGTRVLEDLADDQLRRIDAKHAPDPVGRSVARAAGGGRGTSTTPQATGRRRAGPRAGPHGPASGAAPRCRRRARSGTTPRWRGRARGPCAGSTPA